ncbi:MAG: hypothetical protein Kow0089_00610 [Desulfobulbaceae bacterium]
MGRRGWEVCGVIVLMLGLGLVSTWPLALHFDTGIPYSSFGGPRVWNRSGDQVQLLYWFWLVKENFLGHVPFDSNPFEFNTGVPHPSSGLNTIPLAFLFMLFSPLGDVTAYNCTIITSYVLTGTFMYLLANLWSGSRAGALLAAVIFTFAPGRVSGLGAGHGYGWLYFCYPFVFYFLEKGIRARRMLYGIVAAGGLVFLAMLEPHLIYYLCVFLGLYIPVRIISLFPARERGAGMPAGGIPPWPARFSLLLLWGSAAAALVYGQALFHYRDHEPLFPAAFWWALAAYPILPVLGGVLFAELLRRLAPLDLRQGLAVAAGSLLPLYLLVPLAVLPRLGRPPETTTVVVVMALLVTLSGCFLLRRVARDMGATLVRGIRGQAGALLAMLPVLLAMGGVTAWILASKLNRVAATIAAGGRRLDDVGLYSSRLGDVLVSTSNVYIGLVPAAVGVALLFFLLRRVLGREGEGDAPDPVLLLHGTVAYCCFFLALGLALKQFSLYAFFYHYFPFFNYPRVSDRIIIMTLFGLALLTAVLFAAAQNLLREGTGRVLVGLAAVAAAWQLHDYNVFRPMGINILDRGQDIYAYVKKNIGDGLLLEIPLWPGDSHQSSLYQHYIMLDRIPRVNGCSPMVLKSYIDTVFEPLAHINQGRLGREQYETLIRMGVRFITVHDNRDVFLEKVSPFVPLTTVRRLQNSPYLEEVRIDNSMYFKTWKGKSRRLHLFRVRSPGEVETNPDKAWYDMPYFYGVNSRLHNQTGRITEDAGGRRVFEAVPGRDRPGFLVYGPYDVYSPGSYRCGFTLAVTGPGEEPVVRLEVARVEPDGTVQVLASRELAGTLEQGAYAKEFLDYTISGDTKLEFRVFYYGSGTARVEKIGVYKAGAAAQLDFLEAEKMVGDTGLVRRVPAASSGKVVAAAASVKKKGDMVWGPGKVYAKGKYRARYLLRLRGGKVDPETVVAVIRISDGPDLVTYGRRPVKAGELVRGRFIPVEADFSLERDEDVSFHLFFTGRAGLELDGIAIEPVGRDSKGETAP